jgi:hypothetical protein
MGLPNQTSSAITVQCDIIICRDEELIGSVDIRFFAACVGC